MTNREAAQSDSQFRDACQKAGITPNCRQYVKWKAKRGAAFLQAHNTTRAELKAQLLDSESK